MSSRIRKIVLENFKAYQNQQSINLSEINFLMGANSSGKSSCIQSLLSLKQTCESKQEHIGLLLTGKYATLGSFKDILNVKSEDKDTFSIEISLDSGEDEESYEHLEVCWKFQNNNNLINGVELKSLEIKSGNSIKCDLVDKNTYNVSVNGDEKNLKVTMNNMFIERVTVPFDSDYNNKLASFLKDTIDWAVINKKNTIHIFKDEFLQDQLERLHIELISYQNVSRNDKLNIRHKYSQNLSLFSIIDRIGEKINLQKYEIIGNTISSPKEKLLFNDFAVMLLNIIINNNPNLNDFEKIWKKYDKITPSQTPKQVQYSNMSLDSFLKLIGSQKNIINSYNIMERYNYNLKNIVGNIRYLGPLREMPKSLYHWNIDVDPNYVGPKGEYFPSVLSTLSHKEIETVLPGDDTPQKILFYDALYMWCQYLKVASEIHVNSEYSFGMNIKVHNINSTEADIMNVGVGTSQVLPVLIMGLISPKDSIVIYEQPELHLHPYSQSRLADFFIAMSKTGKQFIIETHSEYMLHRLRYNLLKKKVSEPKIKLNFFSNSEFGTKVYEGLLEQNGSINYPENFVDQNQSLFIEMLNLKRNE